MKIRVLLHARAILAAGLLFLSACANTFDASRLGVPVTMASGADAPAQGSSFKVTGHAVYGLWGVFKFSEPSLKKSLGSQLVGGTSVADLKIKVRSRFFDVLITGLTLGLIVPRSVTFEGVVVQPK
ncbi:MAG TPA: hypothetical protein VLB12_02030 [Gemmatimonadales bacterium]|nr:hypothetical protein [Gemmatimonadales bacterium]